MIYPTDAEALRLALLDAFDRQRQVNLAARLVARHLTLGYPPEALIATLARALLREDAGFHAYQMLEAGVRQFSEWGNTNEGRHILIAVVRYLAAHSPTERAALQTADIARRLLRGIINPAMIATWVLGLWLAWNGPDSHYGWFVALWLHAKLALVVALSAVHGL